MRSPSRPAILPPRGRGRKSDLPRVDREGWQKWMASRRDIGGQATRGRGEPGTDSSAATMRSLCPLACHLIGGSVLSGKGDL
jgi:hypothetical protein